MENTPVFNTPEEMAAAECNPRLLWSVWRQKMGIPADVKPLDPELRVKFLSAFNATPPVSDYNPARIYLIAVNMGTVVAFFVDESNTCVSLINPIPMNTVRSWMASLQI